MVEAETARYFSMIGVCIILIGGILIGISIDTESQIVTNYGILICIGGAALTIYYITNYHPEKINSIKCSSCGAKNRYTLYICPKCKSQIPRFYHQKFDNHICGHKSRYDKYGSKCRHCSEPLPPIFYG